ncbi:hypothetical protein ACET3X_000369 [Alternaria dauci]|uniref:Uncharacterized protein n=1 Tax=Alternaria dauci TaxID=48095 RepID=A0ABR3UUR1_9PLEO
MASATPTTNASSLSLKEVLHVLLVCFHAAADAFPRSFPVYALEFRHPSFPVPIWKYWLMEDLEFSPPDVEDFSRCTFLPPWLNDVLTRLNMCDWFCLVMETEVNRLVGKLFGGGAQWLMYWPKIDRLLTWYGGANQPIVPIHSVLLVETGDGRQMIMDGTLRQYLWEASTWLQTRQEWSAKRLAWSSGWSYPLQESKDSVESAAAEMARGYWAFAFEQLKKLFKELDWEELKGLEPIKRLEHVKEMAEEKLTGFDEWASKSGKNDGGRDSGT